MTVMEQGDMEIVAVIMRSRRDTFEDTKKICDYAFNNFREVNISANEKSDKVSDIDGEACVTLPKNIEFNQLSRQYEKDKVNYCYEGQFVGETKAKIKEVKKETKKEPDENDYRGYSTSDYRVYRSSHFKYNSQKKKKTEQIINKRNFNGTTVKFLFCYKLL